MQITTDTLLSAPISASIFFSSADWKIFYLIFQSNFPIPDWRFYDASKNSNKRLDNSNSFVSPCCLNFRPCPHPRRFTSQPLAVSAHSCSAARFPQCLTTVSCWRLVPLLPRGNPSQPRVIARCARHQCLGGSTLRRPLLLWRGKDAFTLHLSPVHQRNHWLVDST